MSLWWQESREIGQAAQKLMRTVNELEKIAKTPQEFLELRKQKEELRALVQEVNQRRQERRQNNHHHDTRFRPPKKQDDDYFYYK